MSSQSTDSQSSTSHSADSQPRSAPSKSFFSSLAFLAVAFLLLAFGALVRLTAPEDVFHFEPIHLGLAGIAFVVFLVSGGLETLRVVSGRRDVKNRAEAVAYSSIFAAILIVLNLIAYRHELFYWDTTEQKIYTLAPETSAIFSALEHPLKIRGFFMGGKISNPRLEGLLQRIERSSDKVTIQFVDPEKQLPLLEKFGITSPNTLHFQYEIPGGAREAKIARDIDEQEIANTVKKLTTGEPKLVYYVWGHGEPDVNTKTDRAGYTFLRESIEGENIRLAPLVLGPTAAVPEDAVAVILAAPKRALLPGERDALAAYFKKGGKAILLSEPKTTADVKELARPLGIEIGEDVVVDQVNKLFAAGGLGVQPLVTDYAKHPITEKFDQGVLFTTASSVRALPVSPGEVTVLASSSPSSWGETDLALLFEQAQAAIDGADRRGPLGVAAAFEGKKPGGKTAEGKDAEDYAGARVVVFGDADFVGNGNLTQLYNRDLFLNALNWVVGEDQLVSVRARSLREAKRGISSGEFSSIYLLVGVLFPELVLLAGLAIHTYRRRTSRSREATHV